MAKIAQNLWSSYHIMNSDEDQLVVEDLDVGFDESMRLVATIRHTNYEDPNTPVRFRP